MKATPYWMPTFASTRHRRSLRRLPIKSSGIDSLTASKSVFDGGCLEFASETAILTIPIETRTIAQMLIEGTPTRDGDHARAHAKRHRTTKGTTWRVDLGFAAPLLPGPDGSGSGVADGGSPSAKYIGNATEIGRFVPRTFRQSARFLRSVVLMPTEGIRRLHIYPLIRSGCRRRARAACQTGDETERCDAGMDFVRLGDGLPAPMLGSHRGFDGCFAGAGNVSGWYSPRNLRGSSCPVQLFQGWRMRWHAFNVDRDSRSS